MRISNLKIKKDKKLLMLASSNIIENITELKDLIEVGFSDITIMIFDKKNETKWLKK